MKNILQNLPTTFIFLTIFSSSITAFPNFFPNISSIPPSFLPNITTNPWDSFNKLSGCHSGQNLPGISKLKNYFHYFGYIGNKTTNFTDEFDDSLESAVKNYQINFNLNVTGELDQSTVTQILKPRCGVADIVNGFSTMNSGKSESITGNTVRHYSFFPGRSRWPTSRRDLTYAFDPRNQLSVEVKSVFAKAFMRWSEWTPLTFREIRNYNTADIKIGFYDGDHGDGEEFDGVLGTLAHAFEPPSGLLHLDNAETWIIGDVNTFISPSAMHLESVAVHEIGHLLGLGHSSKEVAIMYPTISSNLRRVELDQDDIQGIQMLYGSKPDNNGSKPDNNGTTIGPSFNESDISGAYHGVSMKVYIVLLVFICFIL